MLRNLELSAPTTRSPGRLLVTHWPVGIVAGAANALWNLTAGAAAAAVEFFRVSPTTAWARTSIACAASTPLPLNGADSHEGTVALVTASAPGDPHEPRRR